jgi:hypothetical protein
MKDRSETSRLVSSAFEKFLGLTDRRISVAMMLDVEMDQVPFHLLADGDSAVISFDSLTDAMALFRKYKAISSNNNEQVLLFSGLLAKIGLTICYQNRHFGFIGPNAHPILSKFFTFATSFRGKGKASRLS